MKTEEIFSYTFPLMWVFILIGICIADFGG